MSTDRSAQVRWRDWGEDAFQEAERDEKLILLDITASWCHWCHMMDRTTYSSPHVIELINERFIPIKVDADKRPDIQDRYLLGGWPTTAFLIPDGRILTGTTFIPPEAMVNKLQEVDLMYHTNKEMVNMQVTSLAAEAESERAEAEQSIGRLNADSIRKLIGTLKNNYDAQYGGFGNEPKFPYPEGVRFAFMQYRRTGDRQLYDIAVKSVDGMMNLIDPVWSGVYRYSMTRDWKQPHYEKMLSYQAGIIENLLEAYQVTGDNKYAEAVFAVKSYLDRFLADHEKGGFYASQDADVNSHDSSLPLVLGEDYYSKNEEERLKIGVPYVDETIYTGPNAAMISAYLKIYQVFGDEDAKSFAIKTAHRITSQGMEEGRVCHYFAGGRQLCGQLSDQVGFANALVDLYQTTGDRQYLFRAEKLVGTMASELQDVIDGGFYSEPFDPRARGQLSERRKPFDENVFAIYCLMHLYYLTEKPEYRDLARDALRAISYPYINDNIVGMGYGIALDTFLQHPAHIIITGRRSDERTQEMLKAALHAYQPIKLVQLLDPDEGDMTLGGVTYEAGEGPQAYICVQNTCRPPIGDAEELAATLNEVFCST